jgi:predicted RecB family nuclease
MYKTSDSHYVYSPSDLIQYMSSPFAAWMERLKIDHPEQVADIPRDQDAMMGLLAQKGNVHESEYLELLIAQYGKANVAMIDRDTATASQKTKDAMAHGYEVIFQAYLERDAFKGYSDFLIKRPGQSALGDYYYEAWDTKLSKTTRPYFIVQLCCYSWMLESIQGRLPEDVVVVLGNKKEERMRIAPYFAYFENLKKQFLFAQQNFTGDMKDMPDPAYCNEFGVWGTYAKQLMQQSDSLSIVANIRKSQIKKLNDIGVKTLTDLAQTDRPSVKGISLDTFAKIKAQAEIQLESRGAAKPKFKVLKAEQGKGLSGLPSASPLDVFFDIEGHPLMEGGLEYLWGVSYHNTEAAQGKQYAFKDWWAHDQAQEKLAFEGFIDWVYARWLADPAMHIYHYASYEITAINKMVTRYETREAEVKALLENKVFIDLYRVVQNGLLIGEPNYSIKSVEHLYREKRTTEVANGGDSVVFYEKWRELGGADEWETLQHGYQTWLKQPEQFDWNQWTVLREIRDYNIDDCESTLELVTWLHQLQKQHGIQYQPASTELLVEVEPSDLSLANKQKREALQARQQKLVSTFESDSTLKEDSHAKLLISLLHFYSREKKPQNFAYFQRIEKTDEELSDDDTVISDVKLISHPIEDGTIFCTATFSLDQPLRKDKIKTATIKNTNVKANKITFEELDIHTGQLTFEVKAEYEEALQQTPLTLMGSESMLVTDGLENELCRVTEEYFESRQLPKALETIFNQDSPRYANSVSALPVTRQIYPSNDAYAQALIKAIANMDESCLCIQGPPGAGKTYTAQLVIKSLLANGKRIGIMSNSHAAILNLLEPLAKDLPLTPIVKIGGYETIGEFEEKYPSKIYPSFQYRPGMKFNKGQPYESFEVIGATVYGFSKEITHEQPLDYLFVDEASQVALANLVVASSAAKNIILMGDQMQLEQPIQASHPGEAGASALEFMLKDHAVIPEDKGIFLERTYRMHQAVCQPLSEIVYEGKLQADEDNRHQAIVINNPKLITQQNGILPIFVEHSGNTQSSEEEVEQIKALIAELKTGQFINKEQQSEAITDKSILIVAPYNMQVNLLKEKLGSNYQIGTIDKFQGQEAPVVIISMAVSDVDDSPRGLDFIFDKNRLNVAISRAKALAIVVANKGLNDCAVTNLAQMEKVGFFCKMLEK